MKFLVFATVASLDLVTFCLFLAPPLNCAVSRQLIVIDIVISFIAFTRIPALIEFRLKTKTGL